MSNNEVRIGVFNAIFSYCIWGLLPIYWKLLDGISAEEILANRICWSFAFMVFVLLITRKWGPFIQTLKSLRVNKKQFITLIAASLFITANWFIYIWAVNTGHLVETSLGYYINPLINVLLGVFVFKERLSPLQYLSFVIAFIGVLILTVSYGRFPWIAFSLALSFGLYGLLKKIVKVDSSIGLTLETLIITPIALIYMVSIFIKGSQSLFAISLEIDILMVCSGAATAVPLLYFAKGAKKIPLSMLGFLQYIAPTIMLIIGIVIYHETFSGIDFLSFLFIWIAIMLYSLSQTKLFSHFATKRKKEKSFSV